MAGALTMYVRTLASVALLLLCVSTARADDEADVTRVVSETVASDTPTLTFYRGLAGLDDVNLGPAAMERVIEAADVPADGLLAQLLGSLSGLSKRGDQVTLLRLDDAVLESGDGFARLGREVSFELSVNRDGRVSLDDLDGMSLGETRSAPYKVRSAAYYREDGRTYARMRVAVWLFTKTITADVTYEPEEPEVTAGLRGAIDPS
jgi:hypothetical protein